MMAKTHLAFGLLIWLLLLKFFALQKQLLFITFILTGSLLVDIDTPKSKFGKRLKPLSITLSFLFGHRKIFHSIWVPSILFVVYLYFLKNVIVLALLIGYLSHLVIDGFTKQGISLFYPISNLRLKGFIETNSFFEIIFFIIIAVLDVLLVFML